MLFWQIQAKLGARRWTNPIKFRNYKPTMKTVQINVKLAFIKTSYGLEHGESKDVMASPNMHEWERIIARKREVTWPK